MRYSYNFKKKISQNKAVTSMLKNVVETKVTPCTRYDELFSIPIQALATASMVNFVLGSVPGAFTLFNPLNGIPTAGTGPGQFNGRSFFMKGTTVNMRITTNTSINPQPLNYRVLVYKPRRIAYQSGQTSDPSTSLFLKDDGNFIGAQTIGVTGTDLMLSPPNRRLYDVKHDFKFSLQPTGTQSGTSDPRPLIQGVYKSSKDLRFYLPIARKIFAPDTGGYFQQDFRWCISIFADPTNRDGLSSSGEWETSTRATTSYLDN